MLIDWFTVGAQTLNFLILVWLLKRFLYQPILDAIDARDQQIAAELTAAEQTQTKAQQQLAEYQQKDAALERQCKQLIKTAMDEAQVEHQRILDEARQAAEAMTHKRREAMDQDQQRLVTEIKQLTCGEVFAIARKTLADLAGSSLEQRMTEVLLTRLDHLNEDDRQQFLSALEETGQIMVHSAFTLPPPQQDTIQKKLQECFGVTTPICFSIAPHLVSGIELHLKGNKLSWSIEDYLSSLQSHINDLLNTSGEPKIMQAAYTKAGEAAIYRERRE